MKRTLAALTPFLILLVIPHTASATGFTWNLHAGYAQYLSDIGETTPDAVTGGFGGGFFIGPRVSVTFEYNWLNTDVEIRPFNGELQCSSYDILSRIILTYPDTDARFYVGGGASFLETSVELDGRFGALIFDDDEIGFGLKGLAGMELGNDLHMGYIEVASRLSLTEPLDYPGIDASDFSDVAVLIGYRGRY